MWGSSVGGPTRRFFGVELVNNRADGPCRKQVLPDFGLWQPPMRLGVSESTTMGPIGEAVREGAAFVCS